MNLGILAAHVLGDDVRVAVEPVLVFLGDRDALEVVRNGCLFSSAELFASRGKTYSSGSYHQRPQLKDASNGP